MISNRRKVDLLNARDSILELKRLMSQSIIGKGYVVERLLIALLANGNILVEGLPGLAKTRTVQSTFVS